MEDLRNLMRVLIIGMLAMSVTAAGCDFGDDGGLVDEDDDDDNGVAGDDDDDGVAGGDADNDADADGDSDSDADGDSDADADGDADCGGDCAAAVYSECTCATWDPCGWSNDGICDEGCLTQDIVDQMFDDSEDCGSTGGENCADCIDESDCLEGYECLNWQNHPEIKWCASPCTQDWECPSSYDMTCHDMGYCVPGFHNDCQDSTTLAEYDGCGNLISTQTCPDICSGDACESTEPEEDCHGSATSCYSYFSQSNCESQDGCYYSGSYPNGSCSGTATSCSSYSSEYSCESQDGCSWY